MREGKTVVVKMADVEVGVTIIDEDKERFFVEVSEMMISADVEFTIWTELVRLAVIDVDVSDGVMLKAGVVVSTEELKEVVVGLNDEESMVDAVLLSGQ